MAELVEDFHPISLLNSSVKNISKVLANRLGPVLQEMIGESKTEFIKEYNILDGIVALHETMH